MMRKILIALFCLLMIQVGFAAAQTDADSEEFQDDKQGRLVRTEFTNITDIDAATIPDALRVLYTEPPDAAGPPNPQNRDKYGPMGNIDALANWSDRHFSGVIANTVNLNVSFYGDPLNNPPLYDPNEIAVYYESPGGNTGIAWSHKNYWNEEPAAFEDLDALNLYALSVSVYGNYYSIENDNASGTSVFWYDRYATAKPTDQFISHAAIFAAVQFLGYSGIAADVDLDALMTHTSSSTDHDFNTGDTIIFSIRAADNWDGGELVVLPADGNPFFLDHGSHQTWNKAFNIQETFHVNTEEVDAIEASPVIYGTPSLTNYGLAVLIILLLIAAITVYCQKRRATA